MKNPAKARQTSLKIAAVAAACAAVALGLQGCGVGDATPPPVVLVPPPAIAVQVSTAKYQVVLRDAATNALITDPVAITLSGVSVVNASGAATSSFTTSNGLVSFATAAGVTSGNLRVATLSRAAGWTDGDLQVAVVANDVVQTIEIKLTNTNRVAAIPAEVPLAAAITPVTVSAGGSTTAAITAATTPKSVTTVEGGTTTLVVASAVIAPNTRITNSTGAVPAGPLNLSVVTVAPNTLDGRAQVPGTGVVVADAAVDVAGVITTVLTDAAGTRFTNFTPPVILQIPVVPGTPKIDDSGPLIVGDTYPVSVWNPAINDWVFQVDGSVIASGGGLAVSFPSTTFSSRGLVRRLRTFNCVNTVNITGRPAGNTDAVTVAVIGHRQSQLRTVSGISGNSTTGNITTIVSTTGSVLVRNSQGAQIGSAINVNLCNPVTVAATFPTPPTGSINVSTREQCPDGSSNRVAPTNVSASGGAVARGAATGATGTATFSGLPAGTYTVAAEAVGGRTVPAQTVVVGAGAAAANFVYTLTCNVGTGGG